MSSAGCCTVSPAAARCIAHPGFADATTNGPSPGRGADRRDLPVAHRTRERRLGDAVRAAGAAAEAVVVELDELVAVAQHRADRALGVLHVAEVARILDDDGRPGRPQRREVLFREPLGEVADPRRERAGGVGAEQPPVVLHRRAAPRAVDDDRRRRPGTTAITRRASAPRLVVEPGVEVQRAAAPAPGSGEPGTGAGRAHHGQRGAVDVALPCVHHATGEEERVRVDVAARAASAATGTRSSGSPNRRGTSRSRCATASSQVSASSTPWCGSTSRYPSHSTHPARQRPPRLDRGARAFHQVAELAPTTGTRPRSRDTRGTRPSPR